MIDYYQEAITALMMKGDYWATVLSKFDSYPSNNIDTICVELTDEGKIKICYSLQFFEKIAKLKKLELAKVVFEHEGLHILNKHIERTILLNSHKKNLELLQTSADIAINQLIENIEYLDRYLGIKPYMPSTFKFEEGLLFEEYLKLLEDKYQNPQQNNMQTQIAQASTIKNENADQSNGGEGSKENDNREKNGTEKNNQPGQQSKTSESSDNKSTKLDNNQQQSHGQSSQNEQTQKETTPRSGSDRSGNGDGLGLNNKNKVISDHSGWINNNIDPESLAQQVEIHSREKVSEATDSYIQTFGNLPGNVQNLIEEFLAEPRLPYYEIIRKFVIGSRIGKTKIAYSRINRKRVYSFLEEDEELAARMVPFPGRKKDKSFKIGVLIDTSFSVPINNNGIHQALSGIQRILNEDPKSQVILLQVDTQIKSEEKIKKVKDINRFTYRGGGGTNLLPGLIRLKKLKTDTTIVFTDGRFRDLHDQAENLPKRIIWVLPENGRVDTIQNLGLIVFYPLKEL